MNTPHPKRPTPLRVRPAPPPAPEAAAPPPAEIDAPVLEELEPGETLREAEDEVGINQWIDPETGEPAEGQSPPHLEQE
jgi:hypothetical protein